MTEEEWAYFVASGTPNIVPVSRIPDWLMRRIGASTNLVQAHHFYIQKFLHHHGLSIGHLPLLPIVLDFGRVLQDRPGALTFLYFDEHVFGRWFHASIKAARNGSELWLMTYHVTQHRKVAKLSSKFPIARYCE
jgi:hypothetical protein